MRFYLLILEAPRQKWKVFWTLTVIWLLEVAQSTGSMFLLLLKNKVAVLSLCWFFCFFF